MKSKPTSKLLLIPAKEFLIESLKDPKEALGYLAIAYEEYVEDHDLASFIHSLHIIAAAKGGVLQLDGNKELDEQSLHHRLSEIGLPEWDAILNVLGFVFSPLPGKTSFSY